MMENRFINRHSEFISESFSSVREILKQVQDDRHMFSNLEIIIRNT
jgi:thermostable 8-oxoguanine DNA glycosylase